MSTELFGFLSSIAETVEPPSNELTTFIIAGQSNTDGRVPVAQAPSWFNQTTKTVSGLKVWNERNPFLTKGFGDFKLGTNCGADVYTSTDWAFDMVALRSYTTNKNETVYMVKRTKGGTPISIDSGNDKGSWNVNFTGITAVNTGITVLLRELHWYYQSAVTYATSIGKTLNVKSILWHQGEGDSYSTEAANAYYQNFKDVIYYIRNNIVGNPNLPIVFGTISHSSLQYNSTIETSQLLIALEDPYAYAVNMSAGTLLDPYHFDATSSIYLGDAVYDIIKNF
jgi:hypothetical protein